MGKLASDVTAGTVSALAEWWMTRRQAAEDRRLPDGRLLLENGHLLRLLDTALEQLLADRDNRDTKADKAVLAVLRKRCKSFFESLFEAVKPELREKFTVPNLLEARHHSFEGDTPTAVPDDLPATLLDVLSDGVDADPRLRARLLERLRSFPDAVIGLLKRDFSGNSPFGGQAFAALWLQVQRMQLADLAEIRTAVEQIREEQKDLPKQLDSLAQRISADFELRLRNTRPGVLYGDAGLTDWLAKWKVSLSEEQRRIVDGLSEIVARLDSLRKAWSLRDALVLADREAFERRTRENVQRETFLGPLMKEPAMLAVLEGRPVGRDRELADFEEFLEHRSQAVMFWSADPGSGKTRLCVEAARIAEQRGWLPLFLEEPKTGVDLAAAIAANLPKSDGENLRDARVLFLWDASAQSVDSEQVRSIYDLRKRGGLRALGTWILR